MNQVPLIKLNDGHVVPQLGFGTWQLSSTAAFEAVIRALEVGYRHIDTAQMYGNEQAVGAAVRASGLPRRDIFITSKLDTRFHAPPDVLRACQASLTALGIDYLDLFLIHWPLPTLYGGDFVSTWQAFEDLQSRGQVVSIGVSNFQVEHLERLRTETKVVPAVNQIEAHPYLRNQAVTDYDQAHGIATEAWSPLAHGQVLQDSAVTTLARQLDRTSAQVVLRWHLQRDNIVFPKSSSTARIRENFALLNFELTAGQLATIDGLDRGEAGRTGPHPDSFDYLP